MRKAWLVAIVPGVLVLVAAVLVLTLFLVKVLWAWTVPDLFPGAVEQGLVARTISWYTALKVAIFLAVLAGIAGARRDKSS
ncbi:MAG: hypothetical protein GTO55_01160 [Armatimonadetes bacterium]|nr:hypothetical protein [Armatimonadota bacterium]NIM66758.1 hypothetical protein [Armatimonadota bacterium]NIN04954.1 hypothetical protein [Armatimonadota bacterium]NIT30284.1 hypothetical protein [Armatimonadota bacterium]